MSASTPMLHKIVDSPLQELFDLIERGIPDPVESLYAKVLAAYLSSESERIPELILQLEAIEASSDSAGARSAHIARKLSQIRFGMRDGHLMQTQLEEAALLASAVPKWAGEAFFVIARAAELLHRQDLAADWYLTAQKELAQAGNARKALKSYMNHIAARSFLDPDKSSLFEYYRGYRMARAVGESGVAGTCLLNVSRELQLVGAYSIAIRFAHLAIRYQAKDPATLHYFLAFAHRCDLLIDAGRLLEAQRDLEMVRFSAHREITALVPALEKKLRPTPHRQGEARLDALTRAWCDRIHASKQDRKPLGAQEERLIALLFIGPRERGSLIQALWGTSISPESAEYRFKQLLQRIRHKTTNLISYENGKYQLSARIPRLDPKAS